MVDGGWMDWKNPPRAGTKVQGWRRKKNKTTRQRAQHRSPTLMTAVRGMVGLRIKGLPRERYSAVGTHFAGLLLLQARFVPSFPLSIPTPILYVFHCRLRPRLFFCPITPHPVRLI